MFLHTTYICISRIYIYMYMYIYIYTRYIYIYIYTAALTHTLSLFLCVWFDCQMFGGHMILQSRRWPLVKKVFLGPSRLST